MMTLTPRPRRVGAAKCGTHSVLKMIKDIFVKSATVVRANPIIPAFVVLVSAFSYLSDNYWRNLGFAWGPFKADWVFGEAPKRFQLLLESRLASIGLAFLLVNIAASWLGLVGFSISQSALKGRRPVIFDSIQTVTLTKCATDVFMRTFLGAAFVLFLGTAYIACRLTYMQWRSEFPLYVLTVIAIMSFPLYFGAMSSFSFLVQRLSPICAFRKFSGVTISRLGIIYAFYATRIAIDLSVVAIAIAIVPSTLGLVKVIIIWLIISIPFAVFRTSGVIIKERVFF